MTLTVILSTLNGGQTLASTLPALCALEPPDKGWRLVVVDNGSTDRSGSIIESFRERLPLVLLREPRPGKNVALNTALPHAVGDLLVFTDDDVLPRPDWLRQLRTAADRVPGASIFGGPIHPRWETSPAPWLLSRVPMGPAFALRDSAEEGATRPSQLFGPNVAIRASVFEHGYRFDEAIGPDGSRWYAMGSEAALLRRLERDGFTAWHVPSAVVEHIIRSHQLTPAWLSGRAFRYGRGQYRLAWQDGTLPASVRWFGVPRFLAPMALQHVGCYVRGRWRGDPGEIIEARWNLGVALGRACEAWRLRRPRRAERAPSDLPATNAPARRVPASEPPDRI